MNKDFEERLNDTYKRFAERKAELEARKKELAEKEKALDEFREDILLNLMHADKNAAPEGFKVEDEKKEPESLFTYTDDIPSPDVLAKSKAIVVHYVPGLEGQEGDKDSVFVSFENTDDTADIPIALAYALVKSLIYFANEGVNDDAKKALEKILPNVDIDDLASEAVSAVTDGIIGKTIADVFSGVLRSVFDEED